MSHLKPKISKEVINQIPATQLDSIINENNFKIIDVRDAKGIEKQGAIPGATNVPFDTVEKAINKNHKDYNAIFSGEGPYLFVCTGGVMSYMAAMKAQETGVKNVFNLDGGHSGWLKSKTQQTA